MLELFLNEKFLASMHVCFGEVLRQGGRRGRKEKRQNLSYIAHVSVCFTLAWSVTVSWTTSAPIFNHYDLIPLTNFNINSA